ncbi:nitrogenase component 1 [Methyloferula stellata]|uniref:nitrogenase component 1 n=1 Tax=Methyloferula stellata TaxID=876270 RepID=UPI00036389BE|nr:nitrogenase component 1 [Methyloferula stellata]
MSRNPFLPKSPTRWKSGAAKGTFGIPAWPGTAAADGPQPASVGITPYKKSARGRPPKNHALALTKVGSIDTNEVPVSRAHPHAGRLNFAWGHFLLQSGAGWGSSLDMLALAHGPVGCGAFGQNFRINLPGFAQGIESFTALHACTNVTKSDLDSGGDAKLERSLDEAQELFPMARGVAILIEDPLTFVGANILGITKAKTKESGKLVVSSTFGPTSTVVDAEAAAIRAAAIHQSGARATSYDVAIPFRREAAANVWLVSKLLRDIGLNPVHEFTGSSTSDLARIRQCKLVLGFAHRHDLPLEFLPGCSAQFLRRWFGTPLVWTCFGGPSSTDASLRAIAAHFDWKIKRRTEMVIAANRKKVDALVAYYRPRLQDKLVLDLDGDPETLLECYRLLGFRVGNEKGWPGKTGVWRTPRVSLDRRRPSEKAVDAYIAEAKPDYVIYPKRDEFDWRKRGYAALPFSPFLDQQINAFWGYDGFACLATALDRHLNTPWRKLVKPPWPEESG